MNQYASTAAFRTAREAVGLTVKQLADKVGCSEFDIVSIETEVGHCPFDLWERLAHAMGVDPCELAGGGVVSKAPVRTASDLTPEERRIRLVWELVDGRVVSEDQARVLLCVPAGAPLPARV